VLLLCILSTTHAAEVYSRVATKQEILGCWELVQWPEDVKKQSNKQDPWPGTKYQWFKFYEDGHMTMMMSSHNEAHTKQELDSIMDSLPSVIKYTYYDQGVMIVTRTDIKNYGEIWNVSYCIKRRIVGKADFKPGDLVMVLKNVKKEIVYYRQLRRVN
jgi:hypothetical protein